MHVAHAVLVACCIAGAALFPYSPSLAQSDQELLALKSQIEQLRQAGRYPEALVIAQKAAALTEQRFGPKHISLAAALNTLGLMYEDQGRYQEAEPVYKRLIPIVEHSLGPANQVRERLRSFR